jgi:HEAT repeat protein
MRRPLIPRGRAWWAMLLGLLATVGCTKVKTTDELIADLKSKHERDRIIAVRLLPERKDEAAKVIPALVEALGDSDADVRVSAAIGVGSFGPQASEAIPKLQALAKDRDARVRKAAGVALSRIDPTRKSP